MYTHNFLPKNNIIIHIAIHGLIKHFIGPDVLAAGNLFYLDSGSG
jgi:hypothetical protein